MTYKEYLQTYDKELNNLRWWQKNLFDFLFLIAVTFNWIKSK